MRAIKYPNLRQAWLCAGGLLFVIVLTRWILPLNSGLWLDETATHWIVKEGPSQIAARCAQWGKDESVLYAWIAWGAEALGGPNEFALRFPSVVAMAMATFLLYKLASRLMDHEAGILASVSFLSLHTVAFAAIDARPYACGLLTLIGSAFLLVKWLDYGPLWLAVVASVFAAATIYFHPLYSVALIPLATYAVLRLRTLGPVRQAAAAGVAFLTMVLVLPLVGQFFWLMNNASKVSFVSTPNVGDLMAQLVRIEFVPAIIFGFGLVRLALLTLDSKRAATPAATLCLILTWWLVPLLTLFLISYFTSAKVFVPRYVLSAAPGFALTFAWILRGFRPAVSRVVVLCILLLASVGKFSHPVHGDELRRALSQVRALMHEREMPLMIASGYLESMDPARSGDLTPDSYLFSPLSMYPVMGNVIPIPASVNAYSEQYTESAVSNKLRTADEFLLLIRAGSNVATWLTARLHSNGWTAARVGDFTDWELYRFRRAAI